MSNQHWNLTATQTINLGQPEAPHHLIAILNLACPDTREWWLRNQLDLLTATANGQLMAHLKFWSKPKESLRNGNVAHHYINYQDQAGALAFAQQVFEEQSALRELELDDVPAYLQATYDVTVNPSAAAIEASMAQQIADNEVETVPTLVIDGRQLTGDELEAV